ncbi:unnamed protein product [Jaminaea pallidilutea]
MPRAGSRIIGWKSLVLIAVFVTASLLFVWKTVDVVHAASVVGILPRPLVWRAVQQPLSADGQTGVIASFMMQAAPTLTLLSHNIRYSNPLARTTPGIPGPDETLPSQQFGEVSWATRRHWIADNLLFQLPDIFVLQEVLHNQLMDVSFLLGDEYQYIGVGRDDGDKQGEAVPVFWRSERFELLPEDQGGVGSNGYTHFWLSDTPEKVGSRGWDAALTRMCTHVALRFKASKGEGAAAPYDAPIHVFSTHYDHQGQIARAESSKLIRRKADEARKQSKAVTGMEPLIIAAGDLNSPREEDGWLNFVQGNDDSANSASSSDLAFRDLQFALPTRFGLPFARPKNLTAGKDDTKCTPSSSDGRRGILSSSFGPASSFTDWPPDRDRSPAEDRIDFIFVADNQDVVSPRDRSPCDRQKDGVGGVHQSKESSWRVKTFGVLSSWSLGEGGWRTSDHRPVMARLKWE